MVCLYYLLPDWIMIVVSGVRGWSCVSDRYLGAGIECIFLKVEIAGKFWGKLLNKYKDSVPTHVRYLDGPRYRMVDRLIP